MATRNINPRADMEGQLGTGDKRWLAVYAGNTPSVYNSVAAMKGDTQLKSGASVITKGYYSVNDGGNALYRIRNADVSDVYDDGSLILLNNGNVAELIADDAVSVKQFGAKGDGVTDDTQAFAKAFAFVPDGILMIPDGDYKITYPVIADADTNVVDKGIYTVAKPVYKRDKIELFKGIDYVRYKNTVGSYTSYGFPQGFTYDSKHNKILAFVVSSDAMPGSQTLLIIDPADYTYTTKAFTTLRHANTMTYIPELNEVWVSIGSYADVVILDGDTYDIKETITFPNNVEYISWDDVTKTFVYGYMSEGGQNNLFHYFVCDINRNQLRTFDVHYVNKDFYGRNGIVCYDGHIVQIGADFTAEIDLYGNILNEVEQHQGLEFEDAEYINGELWMSSPLWGNLDFVVADVVDSSEENYAAGLASVKRLPAGTDLNSVKQGGCYYSDTTGGYDANALHHPFGSVSGIVCNLRLNGGYEAYTVRQLFFQTRLNHNIYYRYFVDDSNSWGEWIKISPCLALTGANVVGSSIVGSVMSGSAIIENNYPAVQLANSNIDINDLPSTETNCFKIESMATKNSISQLFMIYGTISTSIRRLVLRCAQGGFQLFLERGADGDTFKPASDNVVNLGAASNRWKQLYAGTSTINTSDERVKDNIEPIPDEVLDAWEEVGWYQYQFKDAVAEKGKDKARIHTGAIAQRIKDVFESHGLDAFRYGLLCYDEWEAKEETKDDDGNIMTEAREAGNRYSLRYEEALCMEAAYQRRRADRLEARIETLERAISV